MIKTKFTWISNISSYGALLFATLCWSFGFVVTRFVVQEVNAISFMVFSFLVASIILLILFSKKMFTIKKEVILWGGITGLCLFSALIFQITGLQYTTASKGGLLTSAYIIVVPILALMFDKKFLNRRQILTISGCIFGLVLLNLKLKEGFSFNYGDALILICAVFSGLHIYLTSRIISKHDPICLTVVQMTTVFVLSAISSCFAGGVSFPQNKTTWLAIMYTGLISIAAAYLLQVLGQKNVPATNATIIFSLEPVFTVIFAFMVLGEQISDLQFIGGFLIISSVIYNSWTKPSNKIKNKEEELSAGLQ